jgi:hypothetical protein
VDAPVLSEHVPLGEATELVFAKPVHGFRALNGPLRRGKRSKSQARMHAAVHQSMTLFDDIYSNSGMA